MALVNLSLLMPHIKIFLAPGWDDCKIAMHLLKLIGLVHYFQFKILTLNWVFPPLTKTLGNKNKVVVNEKTGADAIMLLLHKPHQCLYRPRHFTVIQSVVFYHCTSRITPAVLKPRFWMAWLRFRCNRLAQNHAFSLFYSCSYLGEFYFH